MRSDEISERSSTFGSMPSPDDPYLRWIQPDDQRRQAVGTARMTFIADLVFERGHIYVADPVDVAIVWVPPDIALVGPDDFERGRSILDEHAGDVRADHAAATIMAARGHALEEPHWTLQYLDVRSSRQGTGLGAAAAASILSVCDEEALPRGLVSTNPRNVSFYERLGFGVDAEVATPTADAVARPMHRASAARTAVEGGPARHVTSRQERLSVPFRG